MAEQGSQQAVPLSFGAEQLLETLARRVGEREHAGAHAWLRALVAARRDAAEQAAAGRDLQGLVEAAEQSPENGGPALTREEIEERAARHAAEEGHPVVAPADLASAILEAQPAAPQAGPPAEAANEAPPAEAASEEPPAEAAGEESPPAEEAPAAARPRTFRVFVSSTFSDLEQERNVLHERVYPELADFCAKRGARFQPIDLRWGVSEEAGRDQQTMSICLAEIDRCREVTPRPNFLVLLGNRYGWRALPPTIPEEEFEQILARVEGPDDRDLLERWYQRDENAVPTHLRLRPREGDWMPPGHPAQDDCDDSDEWRRLEISAWNEVEARLRGILDGAVAGLVLGEERLRTYEASATEQEIRAGAIEIGAPEGRAFCFIRTITGAPDPAEAAPDDVIRTYVDPDQGPLEVLKTALPPTPQEYEASWDSEHGAPATDHLDRLAADVAAALKGAIERELREPSESPGGVEHEPRIEPHEALDDEGRAHRRFADERIRFFVGRTELLDTIGEYLTDSDPSPLVVHGGGGTGKSALLAQAVRMAQEDRAAQLVYRFIGATPASADGRSLLYGICRELARRYGAAESEVPSDFQDLTRDFRERLEAVDAAHPLVLFIDSLDQLSAADGARRLNWLPNPLPEHVRLVVSTRPGDTLEPLQERLAAQERRLVEVGPLEPADGDELLGLWLEDARRRLSDEQRDAVLEAFRTADGNPLYLRLAFEEARRWIGEQEPEPLAVGEAGEEGRHPGAVAAIIEGNTFARLADEQHHGKVLVSHALGYLAASRYGLSEDELLDLLSRDPEVYRTFLLGSFHVPPDLRQRLGEYLPDENEATEWVRQLRDGERDLTELDAFLAGALPARGGKALRLPVVLWSRLYADLRPYLTERAYEGAMLIGFYHRELGDVAARTYLQGGPEGETALGPILHSRIADYFLPEPDDDGRRPWSDASRHALSELPYHLTEAGEERWDDLTDTITDFEFLEAKASRVAVERLTDEEGNEVVTYNGVQRLQEDYDWALRAMSGGDDADRPRLIVTAVDLGEGLVVRCPHCNTVHPFERECPTCKATHHFDDFKGKELSCPNPGCRGPLKVNEFVVQRRS